MAHGAPQVYLDAGMQKEARAGIALNHHHVDAEGPGVGPPDAHSKALLYPSPDAIEQATGQAGRYGSTLYAL